MPFTGVWKIYLLADNLSSIMQRSLFHPSWRLSERSILVQNRLGQCRFWSCRFETFTTEWNALHLKKKWIPTRNFRSLTIEQSQMQLALVQLWKENRILVVIETREAIRIMDLSRGLTGSQVTARQVSICKDFKFGLWICIFHRTFALLSPWWNFSFERHEIIQWIDNGIPFRFHDSGPSYIKKKTPLMLVIARDIYISGKATRKAQRRGNAWPDERTGSQTMSLFPIYQIIIRSTQNADQANFQAPDAVTRIRYVA